MLLDIWSSRCKPSIKKSKAEKLSGLIPKQVPHLKSNMRKMEPIQLASEGTTYSSNLQLAQLSKE